MSDELWQHKIADFVNGILHGDDEHRSWLREAGENFILGKPLPPPRGGPKKTDPIIGLNHITLGFPDCDNKPCKVIPTLEGNLQVGSAAAIVTSEEFEVIASLRDRALKIGSKIRPPDASLQTVSEGKDDNSLTNT